MTTDFTFANHGSVTILTPESQAAYDWREAHLVRDDMLCWGRGVIIEPRYAAVILDAIVSDGLTVKEV